MPNPITVQDALQQTTELGDSLGRGLSKEDWIELCEELADYFKMGAEAAKEELREENEGSQG